MDIDDAILEIWQRVQRLEGQSARAMRPGIVHAVRDGEVRLRLGGTDAEPYLSPWMPYSQWAGDKKGHLRPSIGQSMTAFAPGGDLRQAKALPFTWSDANPSPGTGPDPVFTYGDVKVEVTTSGFKVSVGASSIELTASQFLMTADLVKALGAAVRHNDLDIGDTHRHRDVAPGGGQSGIPVG